MVARSKTYGDTNLWTLGVVRSAGSICSHLKSLGFHYSFSAASDSGAMMSITCSDGSVHSVHVIFVPDST